MMQKIIEYNVIWSTFLYTQCLYNFIIGTKVFFYFKKTYITYNLLSTKETNDDMNPIYEDNCLANK